MKILVTGGAGFIGSHIVDALIQKGHRVFVVDNLSTGFRKNLNPKASFYKVDIRSPKLESIFQKEKPEVVFHFAAQIDLRKSVVNPLEDADINIIGSLNVLENCRKYKAKKVIFASSGGVMYGQASVLPTPETYPNCPLSPYGVAKLAVEQYLAVFGIPFVVLRFANVFGPRQNSKGEAGVVAIFADAMLQKKRPVVFGSGSQTRDFVYVKDAVEASVLALKKQAAGICNLGTRKETSVNEIVKQLKELTGFKGSARKAPAKTGEVQRSCLQSKRARRVLGWRPRYGLREGLKKTVESFR
ncbi:MAG: NAD-dependent epimerase/dehydratase family protein [Candidatus Wildermuthbacteria bacterium]|nr:NAD-dependent epimerase/dehydratase family protein [Candidatus Wildermuthbacteria bacterium]